MLTRPPFAASTQRPAQQRSFSHGPNIEAHNVKAHEANLNLSRLSSVRSVSGPYPGRSSSYDVGSVHNTFSSKLVTDFDVDVDEARPKKRARFEPDMNIVASPEAHIETEDALHETHPGETLGLPMRPVEPLKRQGSRREAGENPARKANGLTPPAVATRLPLPKNVADFSPWYGQHPEDVLDEQAIKNGYSDKGPSPNQNESNTGKLTIWPSLSQKNNIALHTLSLVFAQVMEKRQTLGRCTAPSSFKPPPRVTVTDTKREAWLRDLANPNVPLRRQSRTIPHGIRGKILLEQCIAKAVPLQRAIWLAKCVGANELRAFRRKGVSGTAAAQGEAKWVRDWTISVEQFMSETINASGQPGWRSRIEYAVKLVTTIYMENLLEKDHFLDWTVASLSASPLDQAPSWLLLTQLYWRDIVNFSRRGRLLAKALLIHLEAVSSGRHAIYQTLKGHLQKHLAAMLMISPECLVLPDVWRTYYHLINEIAEHDESSELAFNNIDARNERLLESTTKSLQNFCDPTVQLYNKLDHVSLDIAPTELAQQCIKIVPDTNALVAAFLEWASTGYRSGNSRIVLVEQLIVMLSRSGLDTDTAILSFLTRTNASSASDADKLCLIIANLIRHGSFSPGRCLKWLITSGAMSSHGNVEFTKSLLLHLPNKYLPQHLSNTRISLLSRLRNIDYAAAWTSTEAVKQLVEKALADSSTPLLLENLFAQHPLTLRSDLADWANDKLAETGKDNSITLHTFCIYRRIFESCGDTDGLCMLVEIALAADDFVVLGSVSDTISVHALEFAVMCKMTPILVMLTERYRILRTQQPLERASIVATKNLYSHKSDKASFVKLLENDLVIYERQNLSAVCSPASDNLTGMHAGNIETDDEIEAVFASGNTMDELLMQRVFLRIMQRAEKSMAVTTNPSAPCRWLTQIRLLDQTLFEDIVTIHLRTLLSSPSQDILPRGIFMLLAADCYSLERIVSCLEDDSSARSNAVVLKLIAAPLDYELALSNPERYHLQLQRSRYCQEQRRKVEDLLMKASPVLAIDADTAWIFDLVTNLQAQLNIVGTKTTSLSRLYGIMLSRLDKDAFKEASLTADMVVSGANSLNINLCAAWLDSNDTEGHITRDMLIDAVMSGSQVWPILLQSCPPAVVKELHTLALEHLLKDGSSSPDTKYTAIFDVTHALMKQNVDQSLLSTITTRLKAAAKVMSTCSDDSVLKVTLAHVQTLLHIITLCTLTSSETDSYTQGRAYIVMTLSSILTLPVMANNTTLAEYITDVRGTLLDRLPGEVIAQLNRSALDQSLNTSCFGSASQPDSWLALASAVQPAASLPSATLLKPGGTTAPNLQTATRNAQLAGLQQQQMMRSSRTAQQNVDFKYTPYVLRRWEVMPDPTPVIGENDSSISLTLFGARKS